MVSQITGRSTPRVEVNLNDPFILDIEKDFRLSTVIPKYDRVITAIDLYYQDRGSYPSALKLLVPDYLTRVPGIYLRSGEDIRYEPTPCKENPARGVEDNSIVMEKENFPPFTFLISGHYPGLAFIHGWELVYCPSTFSGCAPDGDRHIRSFRVNDRWIWISSSAL